MWIAGPFGDMRMSGNARELGPEAWRRSGRPGTSTWTPAPSAGPGGIRTLKRVSLMDRIKHEACPADGGGMSMLRSPEVGR
jgi:hypothetical protein